MAQRHSIPHFKPLIVDIRNLDLLLLKCPVPIKRTVLIIGCIYTVAPDCYGPPKMLILVFIKFRENQE